MKEKIIDIIKDVASKRKIDIKINDSNMYVDFKKMGIDSIDVINMIVTIEDRLGVKLDDEQLIKIKTINQLVMAFESKCK